MTAALAKRTARDNVGGRHVGNGSGFAAKIDQRYGDAVLALAGDSTGDETVEWFSKGLDFWLAERPWISCEYNNNNDAGGNFTTTTKQTSNVAPVTVWSDAFTRTDADLYGDAPDAAPFSTPTPLWGGGGTAPGSIKTNGTSAEITASSTPGPVLANHGVRGDVTATATDITIDTSTHRGALHLGGKYLAASLQVYLYINVAANGAASFGIWRIADGVSSLLGASSANPIPQNATTTFNASISVVGTTVSATVNGTTISRSLTGREAQLLSASTTSFLQASASGMAGVTIGAFAVTAQPGMQNLRVYNGSMAGSRLDYQVQRLARLYPEPTDLLLVSSCHNYTADDARTYPRLVQQFVESYRNAHPESGVALVSQNPEFPPSGGQQLHNARNATLKHLAAQHGFGYVPGAEAFAALSDRGRSLIRSDGLHPLGSVESADPANGSYLWATVFRNWLNDLSVLHANGIEERRNFWSPLDMGHKAWAFDPGGISTASNWTSGTLQVIAMVVRRPTTISKVILSIGAAAGTPTAGQSLVGIYQNGARLGQSADQSASGFASTGRKDIDLTAPVVVQPGIFHVVILCVATTTPQIHAGGSAGAMNSASVVRFGTANTGQTSLPTTLGTIAGATPNQRAFWAAVA